MKLLTSYLLTLFAFAAAIDFISTPVALATASKNSMSFVSKSVPDTLIIDGASRELFNDRYFSPEDLHVESHSGIVTIRGPVRDLRSKERAIQILEQIKGVRSVVDEMTLAPSNRADAKILKDVTSALRLDASTKSLTVRPSVAKGLVTLVGTVKSWPEKANVAWVVKGVTGVTGVRNDLGVNFTMSRPAFDMATDIRSRLEHNPWINSPIQVNVTGDKAILTGTVATLAEKHQAYESAWTASVDQIDIDGIKIDPSFSAPASRRTQTQSAVHAAEAIRTALVWDPRVLSSNVSVGVTDGVATLRGLVETLKAKTSAESDAKNTVGIFAVVNDLQVATKRIRSDATIKKDVIELLLIDPLVDRYEIKTMIRNGDVTLTGNVDTLYEKNYAEDDASRILGVKTVTNAINVRLPPVFNALTREKKDASGTLSGTTSKKNGDN